MSLTGFNPRYGYDSRQYQLLGDVYGNGYGMPPAYDVFVPQPPPGYYWVDVGAAGAVPVPPTSMGIPAVPYLMNQWNQFSQYGQGFNGVVPDGGFPGINYRNAFGGVGMEPGYNYIFPKDHCKIHVIISATPPWDHAGPFEKRCFNVPIGITVKELMQQFGCTNPDPEKNQLYELSQGGDGTWYKGITVKGSDEKQMKKRIEEIGWNAERNGRDQDFVWLYFTKD